MDIHGDKFLFKLFAGIGFIFFIILALWATSLYGLKGFLLAIWIVLSLALLFIFVACSVNKLFFRHKSSNFAVQYTRYFLEMEMYQIHLGGIILIWLVLTALVVSYLDKALPTVPTPETNISVMVQSK